MRSEFEFIDHIKKSYGLNRIGDDCAVLPKDAETDFVITADMLVEDVDFKLKWTTPKFLGHKALGVSLSDVAAMGAKPVWAMLSIAVPKELWKDEFAEAFFDGYAGLAAQFNVEIIGGDISKSSDKFVIDSIVGGEVEKGQAILRSGAEIGDKIFVTGVLGGAAGGLQLLEKGVRYGETNRIWENKLLLRQLTPWPNVVHGRLLKDLPVSSMIDISDGLSSDLAHICDSSGVGAMIYADQIPIDKKIKGSHHEFSDRLDLALNGGEDFELLFTADTEKISPDKLEGFTCIGEVTGNAGIIELILDNETRPLKPKGFQHFR